MRAWLRRGGDLPDPVPVPDEPIALGTSPTLGIRAVLATRDIAVGEVVARCPVVVVPGDQASAIEATVLSRYYFKWSGGDHAIVMGLGSLMNHAYDANTDFRRDRSDQTMVFTVVKPVRQGEEVTINYNGRPDDASPLGEGYGF